MLTYHAVGSIILFKMYTTHLLSLFFLLNWTTAVRPDEDFRTKCLKFEPRFGNVRVERIEHRVKGSTVVLPYRHSTCGGPGNSATLSQDICRVALRIDTSERSGIHFEAWFPAQYSGRVLATGNGGLNGCKYSTPRSMVVFMSALSSAGFLRACIHTTFIKREIMIDKFLAILKNLSARNLAISILV